MARHGDANVGKDAADRRLRFVDRDPHDLYCRKPLEQGSRETVCQCLYEAPWLARGDRGHTVMDLLVANRGAQQVRRNGGLGIQPPVDVDDEALAGSALEIEHPVAAMDLDPLKEHVVEHRRVQLCGARLKAALRLYDLKQR